MPAIIDNLRVSLPKLSLFQRTYSEEIIFEEAWEVDSTSGTYI